MILKLTSEFFNLNGPIFLLLLLSTVYLIVILRFKKLSKSKNLKIKLPLFGELVLDKLILESNLVEKINIISHSFLIGFHLLLLVSLLFISNIKLFNSDYQSINHNLNVLNLPDASYQSLINSKNQANQLKNYCETNQLNSICIINDQIYDQINKKLENFKESILKSDKNDLNKENCKDNLNGSKKCQEKNIHSNENLKNENLRNEYSNKDEKSNNEPTIIFNQIYLAELDRLFSSSNIGTAFLAFIAIFLSLLHFIDTFMSCLFEFKINNKHKINYLESNYTHLIERLLTPFYIYFDFKYLNSSIYLWFTISWCLLNILIRFNYLKRLSNEKVFEHKLLLNNQMQTKLIFYGLLLLINCYLFTYNDNISLDQLPKSIKFFNLVFSLVLFLTSISDLEQLIKQNDKPINLDLTNQPQPLKPILSSPSRKISFTNLNNNNYNSLNNNYIKYTNSFQQPICADLHRKM